MQQVNLHKQKLFAIIEALLALIALFLTWMTAGVEGFPAANQSKNGLTSWGLLCVAGILAVGYASLMGDKTKPFDKNMKNVALGGFAIIVGGALAYFFRVQSLGGPTQYQQYTMNVKATAGPGLWMALVAGVIGLAWVSGILEKLTTPQTAAPAAPALTVNPAQPTNTTPPTTPTA